MDAKVPVIKTENQQADSDINTQWIEVKMERDDSFVGPYESTNLNALKQEFQESDTRIGSHIKEDNEDSQTDSDNNEESDTLVYNNIKVYSYTNSADDKNPGSEIVPRMLRKSYENRTPRRESNGNSSETPSANKRKRSANFSEEEKIRFLRVLKEKGKIIIAKNAAHDMKTNKLKEQAWDTICRDFNSNGPVLRSTDTLKKLWQKLKSDAKSYRSAGKLARRAGSGPAAIIDNPVLEMSLELTGRRCSAMIRVPDSDSDQHLTEAKNDDSNIECKLLTSPSAQESLYGDSLDESSQIVEEVVELSTNQTAKSMVMNGRPQMDVPSEFQPDFAQACNSIAAERLRNERSKLDLIELKMEQESEYHQLRMQNERQLFILKEKILKKVLKRIEDGDNLDAGVTELALSTTSGK